MLLCHPYDYPHMLLLSQHRAKFKLLQEFCCFLLVSVFGLTPVPAPTLLVLLAVNFLPALLLAKLTEGGISTA